MTPSCIRLNPRHGVGVALCSVLVVMPSSCIAEALTRLNASGQRHSASLFMHLFTYSFLYDLVCLCALTYYRFPTFAACRQSALRPATQKIGRCSLSALPQCAWCGMMPCSTGCLPASYLKALISLLSLGMARYVVTLHVQLSESAHIFQFMVLPACAVTFIGSFVFEMNNKKQPTGNFQTCCFS